MPDTCRPNNCTRGRGELHSPSRRSRKGPNDQAGRLRTPANFAGYPGRGELHSPSRHPTGMNDQAGRLRTPANLAGYPGRGELHSPSRHPAGMNDQAGRLRTASAEAGKFGLVHVGGATAYALRVPERREATGGDPLLGYPPDASLGLIPTSVSVCSA